MMTDTQEKAQAIVAEAEKLPSVSPVAIKLIKIIDDPKVSRAIISENLGLDEVLAANVFKYANSAAVGARKPFVNIPDIVDYVGFNTIKNIALFVAAKSAIGDQTMWFRAVFISLTVKRIATMLNEDIPFIDEAYMLALFHNIGSLTFKLRRKREFEAILEESESFQDRIKKEGEAFGLSHLELSATLLNKWGFPQAIIEMVLFQADHKSEKFGKANAMVETARRLFEIDESSVTNANITKALNEGDFQETMKKYRINEIDFNVDLLYGLLNAAEASAKA